MSQRISESLRAYIEARGGVITETRQGHSVDFPEQDGEPAEPERQRIDAAIQRAREYGTTVVRLWRERGSGWFAATSHLEHPGYSYVLQIDERTGEPLRCECVATAVCHHAGAAIAAWREQAQWAENEAETLAAWEATLAVIREHRPSAPVEEEW